MCIILYVIYFILFYFILGAEHEENKTDGVKNSADQEHLSEENLFYISLH